MIDRVKLRDDAEQEAEQFLQTRPEQIESDLTSTDAAVSASRAGSQDDINDVIRSVGGKYNLNPDALSAAAAPGIQRTQEDLDAVNKNALAIRRAGERKGKINTTINFLFQRLTAAGVDEKAARQVAMQYAMDSQRREATSVANEKERKLAMEKQDIIDTVEREKIAMQRKFEEDRRKSAILNSVVRSFTGLAGMGVGFLAGGPVGAAVGGTVASNIASPTAGVNGFGVPEDDTKYTRTGSKGRAAGT